MDPDLIFAPIIVFLVIVAPIWIIVHYRTMRRRDELEIKRKQSVDSEELQELADRLERRVEALETILDDEVPGWRKNR